MTERRKELLKRGQEAAKEIEGMKTYNSDGKLVLSPIENANENEYAMLELLKKTCGQQLNDFEKLLLKKNLRIEDISILSVVRE